MTAQGLLTIEPEKINQPMNAPGGSGIKILFSLFDVPERACSFVDKKTDRFGLRFEYLGGDEPIVEKRANDELTLMLGKNSGRLFAFSLPIQLLKQKGQNYELALDLAEKGVDVYRKANPKIRSRSFEAVNRVLETYSSQLTPFMREAVAAA